MPLQDHIPPPFPATRSLRLVEGGMLVLVAIFFGLHFVHLSADFPNHSPWMDWSKYTDEGWYGDAAIRHFQRGHWYVPGDFNPAAALPVWPFVEGIFFRFTGVSLVAARTLTVCVFGGTLLAAFFLIRRWQPLSCAARPATQLHLPFVPTFAAGLSPIRPAPRAILMPSVLQGSGSFAPALAVLLLAVSPFCFAFFRMAILEPMLILLTLLALHAASSCGLSAQATATETRGERTALAPILALGLLLPALVLTKTTAIFLFPSIAYLLWASCRYRLGPFLRRALPAGALGLLLWSLYFFLAVRPRFLEDYRYLFSANAYTGITLATAVSVVADTLRDGMWIGSIVFPLSLGAIVLCLFRLHWLRSQPLIPTFILWAGGYAAFLAYHDNLQPRYYLVPAVPLTLLVAVVFEPALRLWQSRTPTRRISVLRSVIAIAVAGTFAVVVLRDARETLHFVRHPDYTLLRAASGIAQVVKADPSQNPLVLSISGSDLSLMTGLPSICDDFGTLELADRVKQYRPGWYAAWNQIDDDKMDALTPLYHPVRVAAFPAMDDPERNLLILYRLDSKTATAKLRSRRKPIPRPLQTDLGQQPSVSQLQH